MTLLSVSLLDASTASPVLLVGKLGGNGHIYEIGQLLAIKNTPPLFSQVPQHNAKDIYVSYSFDNIGLFYKPITHFWLYKLHLDPLHDSFYLEQSGRAPPG